MAACHAARVAVKGVMPTEATPTLITRCQWTEAMNPATAGGPRKEVMAVYGTVYQTVRCEQVSRHAEKTVKCAKCGKRLRRQRTFCQTINPWNKTADGRVKTRADIMRELTAQVEAWRVKPELCSRCEAEAGSR